MVKRLFITKKYNPEGIYKIRLCKNGEWVVVTVDDYIPCFFNASPIFTRAHGPELWVLLLEKAYAKLHGSYSALRYGFTHHGMLDLTGFPTALYLIPPKKERDDPEFLKENIWSTLTRADD